MATDHEAGEVDYVPVGEFDQLREESRDVVSAGGHAVALFHHEDEVYVVDDRCPHMGFPLSKGTVEDGLLTCHWHTPDSGGDLALSSSDKTAGLRHHPSRYVQSPTRYSSDRSVAISPQIERRSLQ